MMDNSVTKIVNKGPGITMKDMPFNQQCLVRKGIFFILLTG
jgi:hypothetical protein